jgi:hypothetical protein
MLTRQGYLSTSKAYYLAGIDPDNLLKPLQSDSSTYRIALDPRA